MISSSNDYANALFMIGMENGLLDEFYDGEDNQQERQREKEVHTDVHPGKESADIQDGDKRKIDDRRGAGDPLVYEIRQAQAG